MKKGAPFYAKQLLALYEEGPINEYTDAGISRKERLHLAAVSLLNELADTLGIIHRNIFSNFGGKGMIGDITMRSATMNIGIIGTSDDEYRVAYMDQRNWSYFSDMQLHHMGLKDFENYDQVLAKFMELLPEEA